MRANRLNLTIVGILAAGLVGLANAADPLEDAMYEAMVLCGPVDQVSIESCGQVGGRSPAHSAARKAVGRLYTTRTAFMNACMESQRMGSCADRATYLMLGGFNRALAEEAKAKHVK